MHLPYFHFIKYTSLSETPISFEMWFRQKVVGRYRDIHWPINHTSTLSGNWRNIYCGINTSPGYSPGNYIQAIGKIYIDDYTMIAPNVGIISANHDLYDTSQHIESYVRIGKYCWIGFGSVVLPGVSLGDFTIVAAGAIVTKSFHEGHCVIAGNPAKIIKFLEKEKCIRYTSIRPYNGYIPHDQFDEYRKKNLNV